MFSRRWSLPLLIAAFLLLSGCLPGQKPAYLVHLYTLDYAPPVTAGVPVSQPVKIGRFSVAQVYNSTAMPYKAEPYKVAVYTYDKWRTNPGDMVTDYLLRDFEASGLFRAVFSYRNPESTRFRVEGGVQEFLESREKDGWKVLLALQVTLLDLDRPEVTRRVVFQKGYRAAQPITGESPEAFAAGMSEAMSQVSRAIMNDVHAAVAERS